MASPRAITSLSTWTFWKKPRLPPRGFFLFRSGRPVALRRKRHVLGAEHARAAMLEAEQRSAVARERIAIGDGAEEIDGRGAELDLAHLFLGERLWQARLDGEAVAAGIDGALAALWRAPVEAVGHRIEHSAIGPVAHAVRRRLTEIADGAFDHGLLSGGDAGDEGFARPEIGAELHLGEVVRAGDEIARGEPQEDGGEQKEKREGSDDVVAVRGVELRQALRVLCATSTVVPWACGAGVVVEAAGGDPCLRQALNEGAVQTSRLPIRSRTLKKTQARSLSIPAAPITPGAA